MHIYIYIHPFVASMILIMIMITVAIVIIVVIVSVIVIFIVTILIMSRTDMGVMLVRLPAALVCHTSGSVLERRGPRKPRLCGSS